MNSTIKSALIFSLGAAIGSVVTWRLIKSKYEQIADEEIESVKERFAIRKDVESDYPKMTLDTPKMEKEQYKAMVDTLYAAKTEKEKGDATGDEPYVIPPEDFGEIDEHDTISLSYYEDDVIVDDDDEVVEDVEEKIGPDISSHFGEYEDDSVYVRNNRLKVDYEILRIAKPYFRNFPPNEVEE